MPSIPTADEASEGAVGHIMGLQKPFLGFDNLLPNSFQLIQKLVHIATTDFADPL
jgi:hypothetical protein